MASLSCLEALFLDITSYKVSDLVDSATSCFVSSHSLVEHFTLTMVSTLLGLIDITSSAVNNCSSLNKESEI